MEIDYSKPKLLRRSLHEGYQREGEGQFHSVDIRTLFFCVNKDEKTIQLFVAESGMGNAIGKGGVNIRRLERNTGMKCELHNLEDHPLEGWPVDCYIAGGKIYSPNKRNPWEWDEEDLEGRSK